MKNPFEPSRTIEIAYERAIRKLISSALPQKRAEQSLETWIGELLAMSRNAFFAPVAEKIAQHMTQRVYGENVKAWRNAAAWSKHGRTIHKLLREELSSGPIGARYDSIIRQNAQLIRSVPAEVAQRLSANLAKAQQAGMRSEHLARIMQDDFPRLAESKVRLIARTEVAKAASALTEARARNIGLVWTRWMTSRDARVRPSHRNLNGVLVAFDDLPSPEALIGEKISLGHYGPGGCPNCRCSSMPLIAMDDVSWPHRVYAQGRIVQMQRAQFAAVYGKPEIVAA